MAENEPMSRTPFDWTYVDHQPYFYYCTEQVTIKLNEWVEVVTKESFDIKIEKGRIIRIKRIISSDRADDFVLVFRMEDKRIMFSTRHHRVKDEHEKYGVINGWKGLSLLDVNKWLSGYYTDIFQGTNFENVEEISYTVQVRRTK